MSPIDVVLDREQGLVVQPHLVVVLNERLHSSDIRLTAFVEATRGPP